ncbi:hypothetical protein B0H34DRAFT_659915 [Crassisporium funariophilum]|nr:hypothetical protein B0H34DRAFT_659915 [Crassisporium funariophilum]
MLPTIFLGGSSSQTLPLHQAPSSVPNQQAGQPATDLESGSQLPDAHSALNVNLPDLTPATTRTQASSSAQLARPGLSDAVESLVAVTSVEFERYERNVTSEKVYFHSFPIHPLHTCFDPPEPPGRWVPHIHPEGALYFSDDTRDFLILTDVHLYDVSAYQRLETYIEHILSYIKKYDLTLPTETNLALEFRGSGKCGYYFVDHATQSLFWLDEFEGMDFLYEVKVAYSTSLIGHEIRSLYWLHNELFSNVRHVTPDIVSQLKDILIHAVGDSLTSHRGLSPYSLDVLQKMLALTTDIEAEAMPTSGASAIVYRFLHNFYHERFLHLHGEKPARLNRDQSIHPERRETMIMKILSPLLLYGPEVHIRKLRKMSVDTLVNNPVWRELLDQLTSEWKEFTLYATVLLNANVAFLAIQSIDTAAAPHRRTDAQRASYFSVVASIGAIVLGLLLVRQHNTTLSRSFLANRSASVYGLETLALMYSLPYALLMWGMVSFLVAFSIMCFGSHDSVTIVMMSVTWFTLCSLLAWCVSVSYEDQPFWYPWPFRQWRWFKEAVQEGIVVGRGKIMHHVNHGEKSHASSVG